MRLIIIFIMVFQIFSPLLVQARPQDKKGWWWYEVAPKKEEKKKNAQKKANKKEKEDRYPDMKNYTFKKLWNMHPDDFQPLLMNFQKKAVQYPTPEFVSDYYFIQDVARRKAAAFTNVSSYVMQTKPKLSVLADYPVTSPGRVAVTRQKKNNVREKIFSGKNKYALIYFYKPECEYCRAQSKILAYFQDRYKWKIKGVNINEDQAAASRFNIERVPHILLVGKNKDEYINISSGVVSVSAIEKRLYKGMRVLSGETTPQQFNMYEFQKGGAFDPAAPMGDPQIEMINNEIGESHENE